MKAERRGGGRPVTWALTSQTVTVAREQLDALRAAVLSEVLAAPKSMVYRLDGAVTALSTLVGDLRRPLSGNAAANYGLNQTTDWYKRRVKRLRQRIAREDVRAVGYVRVSTDEQADSRAGLDAQRSAIVAECQRRQWKLADIFEDAGVSGKATGKRAALAAGLKVLATDEADVLVVAKLDRLSRSLLDFAMLLDRSNHEGWRIVILDLAVDTTTPSGEVMAHVAAAFAQYERRLISERTKVALDAVRNRGVRLGRPRTLPVSVVERIVEQRMAGRTLSGIASELEAEGVATAQGGAHWYPATVRAVLRSAKLDSAA